MHIHTTQIHTTVLAYTLSTPPYLCRLQFLMLGKLHIHTSVSVVEENITEAHLYQNHRATRSISIKWMAAVYPLLLHVSALSHANQILYHKIHQGTIAIAQSQILVVCSDI